MAENINPMTNECDCVDCHALRYDIAVDAVRDAKVLLADAFIDCDAALEALIARKHAANGERNG